MERDSKRIVKRLLAEGFELVAIKGSHHKFRKDAQVVVVPHPERICRSAPRGASRKWRAGLQKVRNDDHLSRRRP